MKDQLISFDTAKLAKEKNFFKYLGKNNTQLLNTLEDNFDAWKRLIPIPTQSLLARWLRETHLIHIVINPSFGFVICGLKYTTGGRDINRSLPNLVGLKYKSYEDAMEKGLKEALKLIK